ncbi:MAG TPA: GH3 auxin-responsive promoter family protein, partial [Opitutaceae bacterium]
MSARTQRRMRESAVPTQQKILRELLTAVSHCEFGKEHNLTGDLSYEEFKNRVPLRTYEDFAPYVEKMKKGQANILWPGQCQYYAISSGTTAGRTKYLPITDAMLAHFRATGLDSLFFYTSRVGRADLFRGKHLFLGGSTTLFPIEESKPFVAYAGDLSGITAINLPKWAENFLYEPGLEIAQMSDWPTKIKAITQRTWNRDIRMVGGIPSWMLILAEGFRADAAARGQPITHLQQLWPKLECLIHGGVPIGPYVNELRAAFGPTINFHEVYPASEAFIAAQDVEAEAGLRLLTDAGVFYEFLPLSEFDDSKLTCIGGKA